MHVGGTLAEIAAAEAAVGRGEHPAAPFVLVAQPSLFDPTRAPAGRHTLWAYCHVPSGSTVDMTGRIEAQIERFAPGFRDVVIARHTMTAVDFEAHNPNEHGGDISGGANDWRQFFARPVLSPRPWRTPVAGVYLCSASTPPGGGVHGMGGLHAARLALRRPFLTLLAPAGRERDSGEPSGLRRRARRDGPRGSPRGRCAARRSRRPGRRRRRAASVGRRKPQSTRAAHGMVRSTPV